jgi:hypothetical protein
MLKSISIDEVLSVYQPGQIVVLTAQTFLPAE